MALDKEWKDHESGGTPVDAESLIDLESRVQGQIDTQVAGSLAISDNLSDLSDATAARSNLGLGSAATLDTDDLQPSDADLTAIAALSTTGFGRSLLALADAGALRETAGLGTAATSDTGDFDAAGAAAAVGEEAAASSVKVAAYGEEAGTARPDATLVIWVGAEAVEPENAEEGDLRVGA